MPDDVGFCRHFPARGASCARRGHLDCYSALLMCVTSATLLRDHVPFGLDRNHHVHDPERHRVQTVRLHRNRHRFRRHHHPQTAGPPLPAADLRRRASCASTAPGASNSRSRSPAAANANSCAPDASPKPRPATLWPLSSVCCASRTAWRSPTSSAARSRPGPGPLKPRTPRGFRRAPRRANSAPHNMIHNTEARRPTDSSPHSQG